MSMSDSVEIAFSDPHLRFIRRSTSCASDFIGTEGEEDAMLNLRAPGV